MKKLPLLGTWTLSGAKYENIPATVPSCVHTVLRKNGLIPNYFWRKENENCQWIENEDWTYTCSFDFTPQTEKTELVFEGLDTYADVFLNGKLLGETHNMFIPHSFNVDGLLKEKDNLLQVKFRSPVKEVENCPARKGAFTTERMNTRRMQCTYYWDWVDRFVTCGIFLPVYFSIGEDFHLDSVYIYTDAIDAFGAQVNILADFLHFEKSGLVQFEILDPNGKTVYKTTQFVREKQTFLRANISNPLLWWPNGYGEQPLYTLRVSVGKNVHEERFGIRTLRVAEIPDEKGGEYDLWAQQLKETQKTLVAEHSQDKTEETAGFVVIVNGVRIYCRGANWVPCEPFPSEESDEKIKEIIALSKEANVNMIRVWGGGLFERNAFYDACDEAGILVTQDFLMACGTYPQKEEWFLEELKKESTFAAKKLRNHPCLAWWSGDNENAVHGTDLQDDYDGRDSALIGLEPQVRALDPTRRFHRSSPYGGSPYMSITRGTTHTTNFFGEMFQYFLKPDCSQYKEHLEKFLSRFIVEEPVYGNPQKTTLLRFMEERDFYDETEDVLRFHSKTNPYVNPTLYDYGKMFAEKMLGNFENVEDMLFKYEYLQYEWIRVVFENCRKHIGFNDCMVFWMLNDCWPASMSWSIIDYYNLPKAAWYSFKRCAKPLVGSLKKEDGKYILYLSSDNKSGTAQIVCHTDKDDFTFTTTASFTGYSATRVELPFPKNTRIAICDITCEGEKDRCFYKDGALPLSAVDGVEIIAQTKDTITLRANRYIHAVQLEGDYVLSDNYFSMLKGEEITLSYRQSAIQRNPAPLVLKSFTIKEE